MTDVKKKMKQIEKRKKAVAYRKEHEQIVFLNQFKYFGVLLLCFAVGVFLMMVIGLFIEP